MSDPSLHPEGWFFDNDFKNKKMLSCDPTVGDLPHTFWLVTWVLRTPPPPHYQRVQGHAGNRLLAMRILTEQKSAVDTSLACIHAFNMRLLASMYLLSCMTYTPHSQEGATLKTLGIQEQNNSTRNHPRSTNSAQHRYAQTPEWII